MMVSRFRRAWAVETARIIRSGFAWAVATVPAAITGLALAIRPVSRDGRGDYDFIATAMTSAVCTPGFALLLVWMAVWTASDLSDGTARGLLTRPARRSDYLLAKYAGGVSLATVMAGLALGTAWLLVWLLGDTSGVAYGGEILFTSDQLALSGLMAFLATLCVLWAGCAAALLAGVATGQPGPAAVLTLGAWLLLELVKYPLGIDGWVFTTSLEAAWQGFGDLCRGVDTPMGTILGRAAATALPVIIACLAAAVLVFRNRDLTP